MHKFLQLFKHAYNKSEAMSSDETISRQINTAIEFRRQEENMIKEKTNTQAGIVTREVAKRVPKMNNMEAAKLRIKAIRRSTMRRQGSEINLHEILHDELKKNDSFDELVEDFESSSSSNTVVDGEVVAKPITSFKVKRKSTNSESEGYKILPSEKLKITENTKRRVDSIINLARLKAQTSNNFFMAKYGKPEILCNKSLRTQGQYSSQRVLPSMKINKIDEKLDKICGCINETEKVKTIEHDKIEPKIAYRKTENSNLKRAQKYSPALKTRYSSIPIKAKTLSIGQWIRKNENKSIENEEILNFNWIDNARLMTASTFLTRDNANYKTNSINSGSSLMKLATPTFSRIGSRNNSTPYQQYKVKNKSRRKIFTNQLIPSKNKIIKASKKSNRSEYQYLSDKIPSEMNTVKVNLKLKSDDNFIDMLGAIDPNLKIKTLYNFNRINDIKGVRPIMSQLTSRKAIN